MIWGPVELKSSHYVEMTCDSLLQELTWLCRDTLLEMEMESLVIQTHGSQEGEVQKCGVSEQQDFPTPTPTEATARSEVVAHAPLNILQQ
jgi:hypothetical protein